MSKLPFYLIIGSVAITSCREDRGGPAAGIAAAETKSPLSTLLDKAPRESGAAGVLERLQKGAPRDNSELAELSRQISSLDDAELLGLLGAIGKNRNAPQNKTAFAWAIAELAKRDPENVNGMVPGD